MTEEFDFRGRFVGKSLDYPVAEYRKEWAIWSPSASSDHLYREVFLKRSSFLMAKIGSGIAASLGVVVTVLAFVYAPEYNGESFLTAIESGGRQSLHFIVSTAIVLLLLGVAFVVFTLGAMPNKEVWEQWLGEITPKYVIRRSSIPARHVAHADRLISALRQIKTLEQSQYISEIVKAARLVDESHRAVWDILSKATSNPDIDSSAVGLDLAAASLERDVWKLRHAERSEAWNTVGVNVQRSSEELSEKMQENVTALNKVFDQSLQMPTVEREPPTIPIRFPGDR